MIGISMQRGSDPATTSASMDERIAEIEERNWDESKGYYGDIIWLISEHKRLAEELARAREQIASYETGITWDTTCLEHAHNMDAAYARHLELENERDQVKAERDALRAAIHAEHFRSNGSSVYMEGPPQHEHSIIRCEHPLCVIFKARLTSASGQADDSCWTDDKTLPCANPSCATHGASGHGGD